MVIGLIGAGSMGSALARGLGEPLLVVDADPERARTVAAEVDGEVVATSAELRERADLVILAHKPGQLEQVAGELAGAPRALASVLGGTPVAALEAAYPGAPVYRFMPNIPVEVRRGVVCYSPGSRAGEGPEREVLALFGRLGTLVELEEPLLEPATALAGCAPAFYALVVEALVDAGVRHGLAPAHAALMASQTMGGTADVLAPEPLATAALRRRVTSPGGTTARGLAALERGGVRSAFADAVAAVVGQGGSR